MSTIRAFLFASAAASVVGCLSAGASAQGRPAGDAVPDFSAKATDGKTYSLAALTKKSPAVLYFIKVGCPINDQAIKYYIRIATAYKAAKVPFIGVINTNADGFQSWNKQFKVPFTVVFDPDQKIISSLKVQKSPWVLLIGPGRKLMKEWTGYSSSALKELGDAIAKNSGMPAKTCDFAGSPTNLRPG